MGKVEQYRMNAPSVGKVDTSFQPNIDVELALIRSVEIAQSNLIIYLKRRHDYENNMKEGEAC